MSSQIHIGRAALPGKRKGKVDWESKSKLRGLDQVCHGLSFPNHL